MKACRQCGNDVETRFTMIPRLDIKEMFGGPHDGAKVFTLDYNDGRVEYSVPIDGTGLENAVVPKSNQGAVVAYAESVDENGKPIYWCNACCEELDYPFCPFI